MDKKTYERSTEAILKDRKVVNVVPLSNGLYKFPPGITWTINRKQGGFELLSDPCPKCGIRAWISKVPPRAVDFTDQTVLWPEGEKCLKNQ